MKPSKLNVKMITIDHSYGAATRPYIGSVEQFAGFEHLWKDCNDHHELPYNHDEGMEAPSRQLIDKLGPSWYEQSILDRSLKMRLAMEAAEMHVEH